MENREELGDQENPAMESNEELTFITDGLEDVASAYQWSLEEREKANKEIASLRSEREVLQGTLHRMEQELEIKDDQATKFQKLIIDENDTLRANEHLMEREKKREEEIGALQRKIAELEAAEKRMLDKLNEKDSNIKDLVKSISSERTLVETERKSLSESRESYEQKVREREEIITDLKRKLSSVEKENQAQMLKMKMKYEQHMLAISKAKDFHSGAGATHKNLLAQIAELKAKLGVRSN